MFGVLNTVKDDDSKVGVLASRWQADSLFRAQFSSRGAHFDSGRLTA